MALLVLFFGAFDRILAYIIFSAVVFLALTAATLFTTITPVRRWWYPAAPIVFVAASAVLALMLLMHQPVPALGGAAVVLAGLPARALLVRGNKNSPTVAPELEPET
jgi:APA family basic amino acid/polyamine antiporter